MLRILIADDEPDIRALLAATLQSWDLCFASDGPTALELAAQQHPHLLVLDVRLPGLDGVQVCAWLKHSLPTQSITVLMLTSDQSEGIRLACLAAGADL